MDAVTKTKPKIVRETEEQVGRLFEFGNFHAATERLQGRTYTNSRILGFVKRKL